MKDSALPYSVRGCLKTLGRDINLARRRRRFSVQDFADRLQVSKGTVTRLEQGDPGVSVQTLAMAFLALGELEKLAEALDTAKDDAGLLLTNQQLPQRIRVVKKAAGQASTRKGVNPEGMTF